VIEVMSESRERLLARARREGLESVGYRVFDSPLGPLWIAVGPKGVLAVHYGAEPSHGELVRIVRTYGPGVLPDPRRTDPVARELDQYFEGKRRTFDVKVDLSPLTPFQQRILGATARVPYGGVATYATVAEQAGNRSASRAAGAALGANPVPIVVPCHRVLPGSGKLGNYGGGPERKRVLLALEGVTSP
jgi:methylated-DNA-[protein]-cysteine S-methyltransferase